MDVDRTPTGHQLGDQLRDRGQRLLEEHRDVLDRQPLDGDPIAVRSIGHGHAGPHEPEQLAVIQRRGRRMHELAAQVLRPIAVEQDRGDILGQRHATVDQVDQAMRIGAPRPVADDRRMGLRAGGQLVRRQAFVPGGADGAEQPELQPDVDEPRAVEPAQCGGELVEAIVDRHRPGS